MNYVRCSAVEQSQVLGVISEEIALMRRLNHPNIVRLHGVTKEQHLYNIFIEWCAGMFYIYAIVLCFRFITMMCIYRYSYPAPNTGFQTRHW